jgi:hypothetical protein
LRVIGLRPKLTPVQVLKRLQVRLEKRMESLQRVKLDGYAVVISELEVELDLQIDSGAEKAQYFEKLAIGSGAAIAAMVSFLGGHTGRLQPAWIPRCSLVSLVIAMFAALYRNFRYPFYVTAVRTRILYRSSPRATRVRAQRIAIGFGRVAHSSLVLA